MDFCSFTSTARGTGYWRLINRAPQTSRNEIRQIRMPEANRTRGGQLDVWQARAHKALQRAD
jgi:hypothetical protein